MDLTPEQQALVYEANTIGNKYRKYGRYSDVDKLRMTQIIDDLVSISPPPLNTAAGWFQGVGKGCLSITSSAYYLFKARQKALVGASLHPTMSFLNTEQKALVDQANAIIRKKRKTAEDKMKIVYTIRRLRSISPPPLHHEKAWFEGAVNGCLLLGYSTYRMYKAEASGKKVCLVCTMPILSPP